jgi:hypothetical protein
VISKRYITVKDFTVAYGVCSTTLYDRLLNTGAIKAIRVGRRTLIDVESADEFFASLPPFKEKQSEEEGKD